MICSSLNVMAKLIHKSTIHFAAISYQMMPVLTISIGILMINQSYLDVKMVGFIKSIDQSHLILTIQIHISGKIHQLLHGLSKLWSSKCRKTKRKMKLKKKKREEWDLEESFHQRMKKRKKFGNLSQSILSCLTQPLKVNKNSLLVQKANFKVSFMIVISMKTDH